MPDDYATRLSADEITNLVAYLRTQQGRDLTQDRRAADGGRRLTYERLVNAKPSRTTG